MAVRSLKRPPERVLDQVLHGVVADVVGVGPATPIIDELDVAMVEFGERSIGGNGLVGCPRHPLQEIGVSFSTEIRF
jgi:hypothetical protein